jgi:alpha-D-ribose 1-methylphosphonate 5-triphosphate synthase subunit PhnI
MITFISGAVAMASLVAALFFLRFWRQTRDRFFLLFSLAFALDALTRLVMAVSDVPGEQEPFYYLARLAMFGLILVAIIDKNRTARWP